MRPEPAQLLVARQVYAVALSMVKVGFSGLTLTHQRLRKGIHYV